jgi:hypothetical protein
MSTSLPRTNVARHQGKGDTIQAPPCENRSVEIGALACTLSDRETRARLVEWHTTLRRAGEVKVAGISGIAVFDHDPHVLVDIVELASKEKACCPFLDFTLEVRGSELRLHAFVPVGAEQILESLLPETLSDFT